RCLVRDPALTIVRTELDRVEYGRNQPPVARVRAMHADSSPAERVDVSLSVVPADRPTDKPLRNVAGTTGGDGEAHVEIGALPPGAYRLTGSATVDGRAVTEDKTFVVRAEGRELDDVAARGRGLRGAAPGGGGADRVGDPR